jgi:hypothetical protein
MGVPFAQEDYFDVKSRHNESISLKLLGPMGWNLLFCDHPFIYWGRLQLEQATTHKRQQTQACSPG